MQISGKVFAVTGGANGIGLQVATQLLQAGARVAIIDINQDALADAAKSLGAGERVSTHVADVTDEGSVSLLPDAIKASHGQVDGLVNVAGIIHRFAYIEKLDRSEMERITAINFWGTVNATLAFLPELKERPEASLVNISSLSALVAFAGQGFYSSSKGGVKQFSEALYQELFNTNVHVTTVFPGNISTNISGNSGVEMLDSKGKKAPSTTPEKTAQLIIKAIAKESYRVVIGKDARVLDLLSRLAPKAAANIVAKQMNSVL